MKVVLLLKDERLPMIELDNVTTVYYHGENNRQSRCYPDELLGVLRNDDCTAISFLSESGDFPEIQDTLYVVKDSIAAFRLLKSK